MRGFLRKLGQQTMQMFNRLSRRLRPPMTDKWIVYDRDAQVGSWLGFVEGGNRAEAMRKAKESWPGHRIFLSRISQARANKARSELGLPLVDAASDSSIGC